MTSQAFTGYFVRHPKQFRYIRLKKIHNEKVHRHKRKSFSLFPTDYIQLQSVMSSITYGKNTVQADPSKKKRKEKERKEVEKRRRRKKGWKEFVRKEMERGE